ncbi:V-type proton ATPase subunit G [Fasciola hepatica]|uniref:V-type proton ATPase subunit G n=1 Tax=Fasciola hepatica TaxID=6192 RepID=A0A4E0RET6_FASHE|nr:V-type proton ATPase subunit G [Fasciola hepatica]
MASRNDGIQLLLQAEKSASDKVNEAKRRKAKRLKEAKVEAQAEIEAERSEMERHFKTIEERNLDRRSEIQTQIDKLTTDIIKTQSASVNMHKDDAINLLLSLVMEIEPRLHPNYRIGTTV